MNIDRSKLDVIYTSLNTDDLLHMKTLSGKVWSMMEVGDFFLGSLHTGGRVFNINTAIRMKTASTEYVQVEWLGGVWLQDYIGRYRLSW